MRYQIVIAGFGGQGAVFLVKVLSIAANLKNQKCLGTENHGMSQRGGSVSCYVKLGNFFAPAIDEAQANLLIGLESAEALRNIQYLRKDATIIVNSDKSFPKLEYKSICIDAFKKAKSNEFPIQALNVYMLGVCLAKDENFPFSQKDIEESIKIMNPKVAEANIKVLQKAINDIKFDKS